MGVKRKLFLDLWGVTEGRIRLSQIPFEIHGYPDFPKVAVEMQASQVLAILHVQAFRQNRPSFSGSPKGVVGLEA